MTSLHRLAGVLAAAVALTAAGCGDPAGPDIDSQAVGAWDSRIAATDDSGVLICTYTVFELDLNRNATFRFKEFRLSETTPEECEPSVVTEQAGSWSQPDDSTLRFIPPLEPYGIADVSFRVDQDGLILGAATFTRRPGS